MPRSARRAASRTRRPIPRDQRGGRGQWCESGMEGWAQWRGRKGSWSDSSNPQKTGGQRLRHRRRPPCAQSVSKAQTPTAKDLMIQDAMNDHLSHWTFSCPTNPLRFAARLPRESAMVNFPRLSTASRCAFTTKLARESEISHQRPRQNRENTPNMHQRECRYS